MAGGILRAARLRLRPLRHVERHHAGGELAHGHRAPASLGEIVGQGLREELAVELARTGHVVVLRHRALEALEQLAAGGEPDLPEQERGLAPGLALEDGMQLLERAAPDGDAGLACENGAHVEWRLSVRRLSRRVPRGGAARLRR